MERMEQQINIHTAPTALKFLFLLVLLSRAGSGEDPIVIRVEPGAAVILPCSVGDASIRAVEWTRSDLKSPEYVLLYRDGRSDTTHQHSSFAGRVQLVDAELKNGDVSLRLEKVRESDAGTYECRVVAGGSRLNKRTVIDTQPIRIITLEVGDSGSKNGNMDGNQMNENPTDGNLTRVYVGLGTGFGLVCLTVGLVVVWKYKRCTDKKSEPFAADETAGDQFI